MGCKKFNSGSFGCMERNILLPAFNGFEEFMKNGYVKHPKVLYWHRASKMFALHAVSYSCLASTIKLQFFFNFLGTCEISWAAAVIPAGRVSGEQAISLYSSQRGVMNLHHEVLREDQNKRRRTDGNVSASNAAGEGLLELEVLSISGECILTLNVADSMLGRELWSMVLDKIPSKPGLQLVVSHTSRLVLHESLQKQGLGGQRAQVSATYMPVNLHAAWRFAHGYSVEDAEFSLTGITEVTEASDEMPALLHNLPKSLRTLTFAQFFSQEIHHMRLPAGLHSLTFGANFNQSLDHMTWPVGLQSLTFGYFFNQSLEIVTWPAGLQSLSFGWYFNQSLDNVTWPAGLQNLTLGYRFNQSIDKASWPAGLQSVTFGLHFNQRLDNVTWPAHLQSLTFGDNFNQSLDNVTWPAGLQSLTFGQKFSQSLDNVRWPAGLRSLTFGWEFNQSLDNMTWPAGLQSLTFGRKFNQSLDNVTWPAGLQNLTIDARFDRSLDHVTWPAGLQSLTLGQNFNHSLDNLTWPAALQTLTLGGDFLSEPG